MISMRCSATLKSQAARRPLCAAPGGVPTARLMRRRVETFACQTRRDVRGGNGQGGSQRRVKVGEEHGGITSQHLLDERDVAQQDEQAERAEGVDHRRGVGGLAPQARAQHVEAEEGEDGCPALRLHLHALPDVLREGLPEVRREVEVDGQVAAPEEEVLEQVELDDALQLRVPEAERSQGVVLNRAAHAVHELLGEARLAAAEPVEL